MTKKRTLTFVDGGDAVKLQEVKKAVSEAARRRDFDTVLNVLDQYLVDAPAEERVEALAFKAGALACYVPKRAAEGLALMDEALELAQGDPVKTMWSLTNALGLCCAMGDVDKARRYEVASHRLLQEHGNNPVIKANRFRLHGNMGLISMLRGEHATAYWHFVQSLASTSVLEQNEGVRHDLVRSYLYIAETCLHIHRIPEVWESLDKARALGLQGSEAVDWAVLKAKALHRTGRTHEAYSLLIDLENENTEPWQPTSSARYHTLRALIAQDLGNLHEYHAQLATAHQIAVDHSMEYVLCEIQRVQRMPAITGVVR